MSDCHPIRINPVFLSIGIMYLIFGVERNSISLWRNFSFLGYIICRHGQYSRNDVRHARQDVVSVSLLVDTRIVDCDGLTAQRGKIKPVLSFSFETQLNNVSEG